jgi:lysophospholipid acyltransferase (LPLAT)-like uncharacterized protein
MGPFVALLVSWVIRLWLLSLRIRRVGPSFDQPGVIMFWHGEQFPLLAIRPRGKVIAPISLSPDGRLQKRIMARFGIDSADGSSSRRSVGVTRALLRAITDGATCLVAVDGPRGPRHTVKPGALFLAQRSETPIWCVSVHVSSAWLLRRSWDGFMIPKPFSRVTIVVGEAKSIGRDQSIDALCESFKYELQSLAQHAASFTNNAATSHTS